jgi:hypothetical protein
MPYFASNYELLMRKLLLSERNLVVVLFIMVLVIFSLAQEDTKKIENKYRDTYSTSTSSLVSTDSKLNEKTGENKKPIPVVQVR